MDNTVKFGKPCCQVIQTSTQNIEVPFAFLREFKNHYCYLVRILERKKSQGNNVQQCVLKATLISVTQTLTRKYEEEEDWSRWVQHILCILHLVSVDTNSIKNQRNI